MQKYLSENFVDIFFILGAGSIIILLISALSIGYFVKKIPCDYFLNHKRGISDYKSNNPIYWVIALVVKNLIGYCLICGGILMLVLPGQGLLTILVGLMLSDYPGKFKLEKRIIQINLILKTINWYRAKSNIRPIIFK